MHYYLTNGKVHVDSDKQIHLDVDTIVSFVIQSGQVSVGGAISVWRHVYYFTLWHTLFYFKGLNDVK